MTTDSFPTQFAYLEKRSRIINAVRLFFSNSGFIEMDTPLRCPAVIPEANIDPVTSQNHFLQASPELCMKRLLSKGWDRIFQICKCFRKNERGRYHLPEFTLLEWYMKDKTYLDLMIQCEDLIRFISEQLGEGHTLEYRNRKIAIDGQWERISVAEAFKRFASKSLEAALADDSYDELMSFEIEPHLGWKKPVFLYDYPAELASLARLKPGNPLVAQRFELYIAGIELANAFTELTDPSEQKKRFIKEIRIRSHENKTALPLPEKFISDLENLDSAAGIAMGVDRVVMLFCDTDTIDDVVAFTPESL